MRESPDERMLLVEWSAISAIVLADTVAGACATQIAATRWI